MKNVNRVLLFYILLLAACANQKNNAPEKGQAVVMPKNIEIYNPSLGTELKNPAVDNTGLKIYTLIDVSCSTCLLKLEKWSQLQAELKDVKQVSVIPVCYAKDNFEMIRFLFESDKVGKIELPLVLDLDNNFKKANPNLVVEYGEFTALTDNTDHILLTGNPIENKNDKDKFLQKIADTKIN